MSDDDYDDEFDGDFIWFDDIEADLAVSTCPLFFLPPLTNDSFS